MGKQLEARCSCHRRPLLAICGRTPDGKGFVHVRAWKAKRLLTEVIVTEGVARIRCRDCLRWTAIKITNNIPPELLQDAPPSREILSVLEASAEDR